MDDEKTTLTDAQIAGLLDLIIAQEKDLLELKASVYALTKIVQTQIGEPFQSVFDAMRQQLNNAATKRGHDQRIALLESMSLQLKQSGKPIH